MVCQKCNVFVLPVSGGAALGGSAVVSDTSIKGGAVAGGSATVDVVGKVWDGFVAVWPLDDLDTPEQYRDLGTNALDGSAIFGTPEPVSGVFCRSALSFDGETTCLVIPPDPIPSYQAFTVSLWTKRPTIWQERAFFSRGSGDAWTFTLGHSYLNHVFARLQTEDGEVLAMSSNMMDVDRWYHVACVVVPNETIKLYLNGELAGESEDVAPSEFLPVSTTGNIGGWQNRSHLEGVLQDVRLWAEPQSAAYLRAEHDNYCSEFYSVGLANEPVLVE